MLKNPDYREVLRKSVSSYFQINAGSVSSVYILWEAHKAFFWGDSIALGSPLRKNAAAQESMLHGRLQHLEARMFSRPNIRILRGIF